MIKWERAHGAWEKEQLLLPLKEFQAPKHLFGPSAHQSHSRIMKKAIRLNLTLGIWTKKKKTNTRSSQGIPTGWNWGQYEATLRDALRETSWGLPWQSSGWDSVSTARGTGSIPCWGTKIPHAVWYGQKIKKQTKINHGCSRTFP